jgi:hypothetical protein
VEKTTLLLIQVAASYRFSPCFLWGTQIRLFGRGRQHCLYVIQARISTEFVVYFWNLFRNFTSDK